MAFLIVTFKFCLSLSTVVFYLTKITISLPEFSNNNSSAVRKNLAILLAHFGANKIDKSPTNLHTPDSEIGQLLGIAHRPQRNGSRPAFKRPPAKPHRPSSRSRQQLGGNSEPICLNETSVLNHLLNRGYNKHKIPRKLGGAKNPVLVDVEVWIQQISTVATLTSDFGVDIYISQTWEDPGLAFDHLKACRKNLTLTDDILQRIWTPNTCFINSKTAGIHESPFKNVFLVIFDNGTVWTNYRMTLSGPCTMNLKAFPMDVISCSLTFESFNYNNEEVHIKWIDKRPLKIIADNKDKKRGNFLDWDQFSQEPIIMQLSDFALVNVSSTAVVFPYPAGPWDELSVNFVFQRRAGWYILQAYVPTYLTIFISWISFYLGAGIAARTLLGVNTLLALTFQFGNVISNLPRASSVKAIDVWMLTAQTFVFCSLLELAFVGYLYRNESRTQRGSGGTRRRLSTDADGRVSPQGRLRRRVSDPALTMMPQTPGSSRSPSYGATETNVQIEHSPHHSHSHLIAASDRNGKHVKNVVIQCKDEIILHNPENFKIWTAENIDKTSSVLFPAGFFIFNVIYWFYYAWWIKYETVT